MPIVSCCVRKPCEVVLGWKAVWWVFQRHGYVSMQTCMWCSMLTDMFPCRRVCEAASVDQQLLCILFANIEGATPFTLCVIQLSGTAIKTHSSSQEGQFSSKGGG